jgi:hypothetical protein
MSAEHVEIVTCCAGHYLDFFKETWPYNKDLGDWVVGTSIHDQATIEFCLENGIKYAAADPAAYRDVPLLGDFCKERLVNAALSLCEQDNWVIHVDADMVFNRAAEIRERLLKSDPRMLWWLDRICCPTLKAWREWQSKGTFTSEGITSGPFGYFQAINPSRTVFRGVKRWYPEQWRSHILHNDTVLLRIFNDYRLVRELKGLDAIHLGQAGCNRETSETSHTDKSAYDRFWSSEPAAGLVKGRAERWGTTGPRPQKPKRKPLEPVL